MITIQPLRILPSSPMISFLVRTRLPVSSKNTLRAAILKGLLGKIKPYTFTLFAKKYGEEKLLDCLERNEKNGVVYHRNGINGDYDYYLQAQNTVGEVLSSTHCILRQ